MNITRSICAYLDSVALLARSKFGDTQSQKKWEDRRQNVLRWICDVIQRWWLLFTQVHILCLTHLLAKFTDCINTPCVLCYAAVWVMLLRPPLQQQWTGTASSSLLVSVKRDGMDNGSREGKQGNTTRRLGVRPPDVAIWLKFDGGSIDVHRRRTRYCAFHRLFMRWWGGSVLLGGQSCSSTTAAPHTRTDLTAWRHWFCSLSANCSIYE